MAQPLTAGGHRPRDISRVRYSKIKISTREARCVRTEGKKFLQTYPAVSAVRHAHQKFFKTIDIAESFWYTT